MKNVEIYTDGGCRGNGQDRENIGGIGGVLIYGDYQKEFKKGYRNTTNNKMELLAVITALKMLKKPCRVTIHSDSAYVVNAFNQNWISGWKAKGWTRGTKVKGHADDAGNNRADALVNQAMDEL